MNFILKDYTSNMNHLQGKVKSISVKEVTEGIQVLYKNQIHRVTEISNHEFKKEYMSAKMAYILADSSSYAYLEELKTLVVEYEDYSKSLRSTVTLGLPLKYSQWQSAIDSGEVDSDKVIKFEIKTHTRDTSEITGADGELNGLPMQFQYAKIIPQKKRMYSEEEVKEIVFEFCEWRWKERGELRGLLHPPALSDRWKEWWRRKNITLLLEDE